MCSLVLVSWSLLIDLSSNGCCNHMVMSSEVADVCPIYLKRNMNRPFTTCPKKFVVSFKLSSEWNVEKVTDRFIFFYLISHVIYFILVFNMVPF